MTEPYHQITLVFLSLGKAAIFGYLLIWKGTHLYEVVPVIVAQYLGGIIKILFLLSDISMLSSALSFMQQ
jgi:hypothetical protein